MARLRCAISTVFATTLLSSVFAVPEKKQRNVLLVVLDDLRPQLGVYGLDFMHTPNMDQLAKDGALFERAYVQIAICSPTRNSFLSGRYPDKTKTWNFIDHFRQEGVGADWTALPEFFRKQGYYTTGAGKVYHNQHPPNFDDDNSWSEAWKDYGQCECGSHGGWPPGGHATCEGLDPASLSCGDDTIVDTVITKIQAAANSTQPHFIAAGLHKPHVAFYARPEDFKLYPDPKPPAFPMVPVGLPYCAWHSCLSSAPGINYSNWGDFEDIPNNMTFEQPMQADTTAHLRRGYYASVTYADSNVGKLLAAIPDLDEWVVALIGDHGWSLGEQNVWCKMTNFENGVHVPLLIRAPWAQARRGMRLTQLTEAVDLYRTLADLSGIGAGNVEAGVDGVSLAPLLADATAKPLRAYAKSQYPRCWTQINNETGATVPPLDRVDCQDIDRTEFDLMGYSIRTEQWRFTEWRAWDGAKLQARWDLPPNATELYDHRSTSNGGDIFSSENMNLAGRSAYASIEMELRAQLREAFSPIKELLI